MYSQQTYKIYINKKPVEVSYFILLCHCTGEFKYLASKEEYIAFFHHYNFPDRKAISNYIINLNSYIDILKGESINVTYVDKLFSIKTVFRRANSSQINNIFSKMSLFSVSQLLYEYTLYKYHQKKKDTVYPSFDGMNKYINYAPHVFSDKYSCLTPHLCFYKRLALCSEANLIEVSSLKEVLRELNKTVKLQDIIPDLEKHMLIFPYKKQYIWGSKDVYNWLLNLDYFIFRLYNLDKVLSLTKFQT